CSVMSSKCDYISDMFSSELGTDGATAGEKLLRPVDVRAEAGNVNKYGSGAPAEQFTHLRFKDGNVRPAPQEGHKRSKTEQGAERERVFPGGKKPVREQQQVRYEAGLDQGDVAARHLPLPEAHPGPPLVRELPFTDFAGDDGVIETCVRGVYEPVHGAAAEPRQI